MTEPLVLLRHDLAGKPGCIKPYHLEPLRRYCERPPLNRRYRLHGIYPTVESACTAMMELESTDYPRPTKAAG